MDPSPVDNSAGPEPAVIANPPPASISLAHTRSPDTVMSTPRGDVPEHTQPPGVNEGSNSDEADTVPHDDDDDGGSVEVADLPPAQPAKRKKKKKSNRPVGQRGIDKATGFEDFFSDRPMTAEEAREDSLAYDPTLPFVDRISTAIARFERTRKLSPERRDIFYKYLKYGSVDTGPNIFQSGSGTTATRNGGGDSDNDDDEKQLDATRLAEYMSQASISNDKRHLDQPDSLYAVDFYACAAGFLSRHARAGFGCETPATTATVTTTLERFMDYLLQHTVAPEYADDIVRTRNLCRAARSELWEVSAATRRMPGDFNIACSTLWGGEYARDHDGVSSWAGAGSSVDSMFVGFTRDVAQQIVHFGVAGGAAEDVYRRYLAALQDGGGIDIVESTQSGFEITSITPPKARCVELYTTRTSSFRPVGLVTAKPWKNPDHPPKDVNPAAATAPEEPAEPKEYEFLIESILLASLRVGTKVDATVHVTSVGIAFFDGVRDVFPSFDTYLLNEHMLGYKAPRPVRGAFDFIEEDVVVDHTGTGRGEDGEGVLECDVRADQMERNGGGGDAWNRGDADNDDDKEDGDGGDDDDDVDPY